MTAVASRHHRSQEEIARREPRARPILDALGERGILRSVALDGELTTAVMLLKILTEPRHALFDGRHVFWGLLERLVNPASVTQKVAIPFATGKPVAETCVSCAVIFNMIGKLPADYVRMLEGLTSPRVSFEIRRAYPQPEVLEGRKRHLGAAFDVAENEPGALRIRVAPDATTPERAAAEHAARERKDYDFTGTKPNTRHLNDVLGQSALTNYVLAGRYVTEADLDVRRGAGGVPLPSDPESRFAFDILLQDFLAGTRVIVV